MFHARKWGWKRIAAKLLLIPVLAGASAAVAHAQFNPVPPQTSGAAMPGKPGGDAKALLKEGRKALAAGQFDRAQDLARAAEANNQTGKWGLFDDTPNALLKDVQASVLKAQKTQADQLVKQAKGLISKQTQSEAEKAANLDQALQMAQRADQLHGPYSAWDIGDRPDKLVKDIQATRGKLKNVPPPSGAMPTGAIAGNGGMTPQFLPASATGAMPATAGMTGANDPKKAAALQLIAEGRKLSDQGMFTAARAKYMEADRLGVAFSANEYGPGFALSDLNTRGKQSIEQLVNDSRAADGEEGVRPRRSRSECRERYRDSARIVRPADRRGADSTPDRDERQVRRPGRARNRFRRCGSRRKRSDARRRYDRFAQREACRSRGRNCRYRSATARSGRDRVQERRPRHGRETRPAGPQPGRVRMTPAGCSTPSTPSG